MTHHLHHHFLHFLANREMDELYASIAIRSFALSIISVFVPLYLLKLGYSLNAVLTYFIISYFAHAVLVIPAGKLAARFGFKHSILFSVPFLIIFYAMLYSIESFNWPLYLIAIAYAIAESTFWVGYHSDFSKFSSKKQRGTQLAVTRILTSLVNVAGPLVGAFLLAFAGFKLTFVIVALLLLTSVIPLFMSKDVHEPVDFKIKQMFKGKSFRDVVGFTAFGIEQGTIIVWPIFIFLVVLKTFTSIGLVTSFYLVFSTLTVFIIGRMVRKHGKLMLKIGSVTSGIIWVLKAFVRTGFQVYTADLFHSITKTTAHVPFLTKSYDRANKTDILHYSMFREFFLPIGEVLFFIIAIWVADLALSLPLGGIASLLFLIF